MMGAAADAKKKNVRLRGDEGVLPLTPNRGTDADANNKWATDANKGTDANDRRGCRCSEEARPLMQRRRGAGAEQRHRL